MTQQPFTDATFHQATAEEAELASNDLGAVIQQLFGLEIKCDRKSTALQAIPGKVLEQGDRDRNTGQISPDAHQQLQA